LELEEANARRHCSPGRLTVAEISSYYTLARAAEILNEDEEWLHELSIDMFAEDGCVTIYGVGKESITAFSDFGIDNLRETILEARSSGDVPPKDHPKPST
jgi:hypothetical protein